MAIFSSYELHFCWCAPSDETFKCEPPVVRAAWWETQA